MDNQVTLQVALTSINNVSQLLKDNEQYELIESNLSVVRLLIESQLESTVTISTSKAVTTPVPVPLPNIDIRVTSLESEDYDTTLIQSQPTVNTYRIEEETTAGWVVVDPKDTVALTKEDAQSKIDSLLKSQGYAPDRVRVVVDGQR
tara:strand:- start:261 stop:701 length:441 start_codon:yes stop_codon:yes gene_type:complete